MTNARRASIEWSGQRVVRIVALFVGVGLLWHTLEKADLGKAMSIVAAVGPVAVVILVPFLLASLLHTAGSWVLLSGLGKKPSFLGFFRIVLSTQAVLGFPAGTAFSE